MKITQAVPAMFAALCGHAQKRPGAAALCRPADPLHDRIPPCRTFGALYSQQKAGQIGNVG